MKTRPLALIVACTGWFLGVFLWPGAGEGRDHARDRIRTEGEGEAEIHGRDVSQARAQALEDALQKAFENALIEILPQDLPLAEREGLVDELAAGMKRYLLEYRVRSEMPALQVFFVTVEAVFSVPLIREDLRKHGVTWGGEYVGAPIEILVRIKGISSLRLYGEVLDVFQNRLGRVRYAIPFEVFGTSLVLRLEYEGPIHDLLEAVSTWRTEEFGLSVEGIEDHEITLALITASPPPGEPPVPSGGDPADRGPR